MRAEAQIEPAPAPDVHEAIELALAEGVNFFDVAPSYGDGRAESNLGAALGDAARRVIIATKVYLEPEELDDIAGAAERSLQASLERLGREHVDVFQLHNPISQERGAIGRSVGVEDVLGGGGAIAAWTRSAKRWTTGASGSRARAGSRRPAVTTS